MNNHHKLFIFPQCFTTVDVPIHKKPKITRLFNASPSKNDEKYAQYLYLVAGGVAGAVSRTATSPLERLKILFQVDGMKKTTGREYTGVWSAFMKITKEEGFYGYFKGNGTNIARIVPYSATQFYAYEEYKALAISLSGNKDLNTGERLIAGAMSGVTSSIITYPLDLIRSRLTVQNDYVRYSGIADAFRKIVSSEGFFALYRGMMPTLMGIAPYVGINFTTYETLKQYLCKNPSKPTSTESLSYGGISGAAAQTVTYPIDLIRRRM